MTAKHVERLVASTRREAGLSLIELAVVLAVLGMAMGMVGLPLLRTWQQQ